MFVLLSLNNIFSLFTSRRIIFLNSEITAEAKHLLYIPTKVMTPGKLYSSGTQKYFLGFLATSEDPEVMDAWIML